MTGPSVLHRLPGRGQHRVAVPTVRCSAGGVEGSSSTWWTTVPRTPRRLGRSGIRSIDAEPVEQRAGREGPRRGRGDGDRLGRSPTPGRGRRRPGAGAVSRTARSGGDRHGGRRQRPGDSRPRRAGGPGAPPTVDGWRTSSGPTGACRSAWAGSGAHAVEQPAGHPDHQLAVVRLLLLRRHRRHPPTSSPASSPCCSRLTMLGHELAPARSWRGVGFPRQRITLWWLGGFTSFRTGRRRCATA